MQFRLNLKREVARVTQEGPIGGSGRCRACSCPGYRPNSPKNDYCHDCGHSWYMHEGL